MIWANAGLFLDGEGVPFGIVGAATDASHDDSKNRDWGFDGRTNGEGERMPIEVAEDTAVWLASADRNKESLWSVFSVGALYGSRKMGFVACSDRRNADMRTYTTFTVSRDTTESN